RVPRRAPAQPGRRTDDRSNPPCRRAARPRASGWHAGRPRPSPPGWRPATDRRPDTPARPRACWNARAFSEWGEPDGRPAGRRYSSIGQGHTPATSQVRTSEPHPMRQVRIGCSGWMYDSWRGRLYPEGVAKRRWLELYAGEFDTVEVNSTFYRLARREAVAGWVERTPPGFLFAVKASRYLTHIKRLADMGDSVKRFYEPLEPMIAAGRLGPVLWQLPENFHRDDERLHGWLDRLPDGLHTIEFRHESWFVPSVLDMLRERGVALTIGDHPSR